MLLQHPALSLLFLLATVTMTALSTAILRIGRLRSKEILRSSFFFLRPLLKRSFPRQEWESLHASIGLSKSIYQLLYALFGLFYLATTVPYFHDLLTIAQESPDVSSLVIGVFFLLFLYLLSDFCARLLANLWPRQTLKFCSFLVSLYLTISFPVTYLLLKATKGVVRKMQAEEEIAELMPSKAQIKELIRESELHHHLDPSDQKLISSFVNFRERVAKEIMVPRVNIFSLPAETSIREAAGLFAQEGYSRIPIYRDSLDEIAGVVLYKDLLKVYTGALQETPSLDAPLEKIAKPVLYAPEHKKITHLLQEFRSKHIHMAIIVDEYGGTEGIVTIEDILEELVGNIEDEYDVGENQEFWPLPNGGWIVDAKMSILDIEERLGVHIPQDPEYETVGGYVYHRAGTIPVKGWRLLHDDFDLEVISSSERSLKKIKIIPHHRS